MVLIITEAPTSIYLQLRVIGANLDRKPDRQIWRFTREFTINWI